MVLLPAPAGPSMAMISLRWEESVIGRMALGELSIVHGAHETFTTAPQTGIGSVSICFERVRLQPCRNCRIIGSGFLPLGERVFQTEPLRAERSANALGPRLGKVNLFGRSYLQQRLAPNVHKAQFTCREQSMDGFFHPRPRNEIREEVLDLSLINRHHAVEIFRNERGERCWHRDPNPFA